MLSFSGNKAEPATKKTIGNNKEKYSSSRKDVATTIEVLFPISRPSFHIKIVANAVPPTADGVIADVNSHNIIILKHFRRDNFFSDNTLSLIM